MNPKKLEIGKVYFLCMYLHRKFPIPDIESYVYVGKDEEGYHFLHPQNYLVRQVFDKLDDEEKEFLEGFLSGDDLVVPEHEIDPMVEDHEGLISFLETLKEHAQYERFFSSST